MSDRSQEPEIKHSPPLFEGFIIQTVKAGQRKEVRKAVTGVLGAGWEVEAFGDAGTDFEVTRGAKKRGTTSASQAWEKTYRLRAQPGILYAEPMFTVPVSTPPEFRPEAGDRRAGAAGAGLSGRAGVSGPRAGAGIFATKPLRESDDPAWSIKEVKVLEAWKRFPQGKEPGEQVVVGHPDTGYSEHPEIVPRLLKKKGYDYVKDDTDAKDELDSGVLLFPGHGTGTSSVIISPRDAQGDFGQINGTNIAVWGVAPGAELIPIRVSRSVVLDTPWAGGGVLNLAKAIEFAADRGAHVVSISMGTGFPNTRLLKAVQYAQKRGVIVLAAAGNYVGYVVWPAAYEEVIAVAASNAQHKTWKYSSHGSAVDVTAPGESVWCAGVGDGGEFAVGRGSGTSFAVATVAGVAALWLSHHGRAKLGQRYGVEKIPAIFNQILRDNCDPMPDWKGGYGRGLVNAEKVLAAPLPGGASPVPMMASALRDHPVIDRGGLATFGHLFESALSGGGRARTLAAEGRAEAELRTRLAELMNVAAEELPARLKEVGQELAFHLSADPALYRQFEAALSRKKPRAVGRAAAPPAAGRAGATAAAVPAAAGVEAVRAGLLSKGTSAALKGKLS